MKTREVVYMHVSHTIIVQNYTKNKLSHQHLRYTIIVDQMINFHLSFQVYNLLQCNTIRNNTLTY